MRTIPFDRIVDAVRELCMRAAFDGQPDLSGIASLLKLPTITAQSLGPGAGAIDQIPIAHPPSSANTKRHVCVASG